MSRSVFYSANPTRKLREGFNAHVAALMREGNPEQKFRDMIDGRESSVCQDYIDNYGDPADVLCALIAPFGAASLDGVRTKRALNASAEVGAPFNTMARGVYMPLPGVSRRDLSPATFSDGGALVTEGVDARLVESLVPHSVALSAGAQLVSGLVQGDLILARSAAGPLVVWADDGPPAADGAPQFDRVTIKPQTLSVTVTSSARLELAMRGNGVHSLLDMLANEIQRAMLAEIDRVILCGSGVGPEPRGILGAPGVNVVSAGADGAVPTWELLTDMEYQVAQPFSGNALTWAMTPRTRRKLRRTQRGTGLDFIWSDGAPPLGHSAGVTGSLPDNLTKGTGTDLSAAILGDFSQVVVALWGPRAIDVVVDVYTLRTFGMLRFTGFMEVGVGIRHPQAFSVCKDLVTED